MTYELALKLKKSGFPQDKCESFFYNDEKELIQIGEVTLCDPPDGETVSVFADTVGCGCCAGTEKIIVFVPTLSELIKACGDSFKSLQKNDFLMVGKWYAMGHFSDERPMVETYGSTPEDAVANLWLALNTKK